MFTCFATDNWAIDDGGDEPLCRKVVVGELYCCNGEWIVVAGVCDVVDDDGLLELWRLRREPLLKLSLPACADDGASVRLVADRFDGVDDSTDSWLDGTKMLWLFKLPVDGDDAVVVWLLLVLL